MSYKRIVWVLGFIPALIGVQAANGSAVFQIFETGTTNTATTVAPGGLVSLDVVAVKVNAESGVEGDLDSFTYRLNFPNQDFVLTGNTFGAPFDNALAPAGFNGSVPWSVPTAITHAADAGSPLATPLIPDLYRTTASTAGVPGVGPNLLLETLTVTAPMTAGDYAISLEMLEAADRMGAFHSVDNGVAFTVTVPEPTTLALILAGSLGILRRRR